MPMFHRLWDVRRCRTSAERVVLVATPGLARRTQRPAPALPARSNITMTAVFVAVAIIVAAVLANIAKHFGL